MLIGDGMKMSVLMQKQVISIVDGQILGYIADFEYDPQVYKIESFCVRKKTTLFSYFFQAFLKDSSVIVKIDRIVSVGSDVVLVEGTKQRRRN